MEGLDETAAKLSNGTSLNALHCPLNPFQGHDYSTSNMKMVQHTAIVTMADQ